MEAVVANLTEPGKKALVVVTGYFGDRLAGMFERYGASVDRLSGEWGRAITPAAVADRLSYGIKFPHSMHRFRRDSPVTAR